MINSIDQLTSLSKELLTSAGKRRQLAKCLRRAGFLSIGKGAWLGYRGKDAVSGLLIEGSPADTYLSSFLLPVFDKLTFVNWSLGQRIVHCSLGSTVESECNRAIVAYRSELLPVSSPNQIVDYIEKSNRQGFYSAWVNYLCRLREGRLESAHTYFDQKKRLQTHQSVLLKLAEIDPFVIQNDVVGVSQVLSSWEKISGLIFGINSFFP